jgi:protein-S-isoprenylcysteine O-methyltransferase Ste14
MPALELKIPPVLLTLLFGAVMWLISRLAPGLTFSPRIGAGALVICMAAGAAIAVAGIASFRKANTTVNPLNPQASSALVKTGIFRFTRNPMYLALLLVLMGWGIFLRNGYALSLTVLFVAYLNRFQIRPEERALKDAFGDDFLDYQRSVRRWL